MVVEQTILEMDAESAKAVMNWMDMALWCMPLHIAMNSGDDRHHFVKTQSDLSILGLRLLWRVAPDQNVLLRDSLNPDFVKFLVEDYSAEFSFDKDFVLATKNRWPEWKQQQIDGREIWKQAAE